MSNNGDMCCLDCPSRRTVRPLVLVLERQYRTEAGDPAALELRRLNWFRPVSLCADRYSGCGSLFNRGLVAGPLDLVRYRGERLRLIPRKVLRLERSLTGEGPTC